jgi:hypothetical protein
LRTALARDDVSFEPLDAERQEHHHHHHHPCSGGATGAGGSGSGGRTVAGVCNGVDTDKLHGTATERDSAAGQGMAAKQSVPLADVAGALPPNQVDSAPTSDNEHDAAPGGATATAGALTAGVTACKAHAAQPCDEAPATACASPVALRDLELAGEGALIDFPWESGDGGGSGWEGMATFASALASGALLGGGGAAAMAAAEDR